MDGKKADIQAALPDIIADWQVGFKEKSVKKAGKMREKSGGSPMEKELVSNG
jgi:hypothetical protein